MFSTHLFVSSLVCLMFHFCQHNNSITDMYGIDLQEIFYFKILMMTH